MQKVFIIVLNWNGYMDTVEGLRSIEKCVYPAYEVVVVGNASTDGSVDRLEEEEESKVTGEAVSVDFLSGSALLVKRDFVEKVGLLDDRFFFYWEENDWSERGRKAGFSSVFVPDARVYHKGGGSSGKGWNEFTAYYLVRNWILFMRKHAAAKYWVTFLPFLIGSLSYWILKALLKGETAVIRSYLSAIGWNIKTPA